ncbi:FecR family protein [Sphingobacterium faecale]|uniref:FecR domain-containing protein n=1 Tax=Sphingobacterium faecale TaxID=2803775 RepID=A0ABS1R2K6_9SPHI|nr:FecR domain-containing protein [Sphingobacterium faecale]MBL1408888.1 FecR domain-containing protein [Sphingobacterium faecale]
MKDKKNAKDISKTEEAIRDYFSLMESKGETYSPDFDEKGVLERIQYDIHKSPIKLSKNWRRWIAVASCITLLAGSIVTWQLWNNSSHFELVSLEDIKILPAQGTAILTLANGEKISLDQLQPNSLITTIDGIQISKNANGEIIYSAADNVKLNHIANHNIETPKGGFYTLLLPDGSKVWLNAETKIKYPIHFGGSERRIELQGEAYFKVAHDADKPFIVKTEKQEITVLGTSFNVEAYEKNLEATTLVEGSVKISCPQGHLTLEPGQQAIVDSKNAIQKKQVDESQYTAWINGDFSFVDTKINDVMSQISRWYNVDIVYDQKENDLRISGMVARNKPLDTVLNILEMTGKVKFKLEVNSNNQERRIRVKIM